MDLNIIFTKAACSYIKRMLAKEQGIGFRLSVKKTGCSGYSYYPAIIQKIKASDIFFEIDTGVKIFIDQTWGHLFQNLTIDYIEEEKSGLKQRKLVFINPDEASRCGCGQSFHID